MKKLLAIRHLGFEDLGSFEDLFVSQEFDISYIDPGSGQLDKADPLVPDLLVILGGPIGAYDEDKYPFLETELVFIEQRLKAEKPILGICLGAQLIARALGSKVYPGPVTEISWTPLSLTVEGRHSVIRHLDGKLTNMLHWHGDTFDLPTGAIRLASTEPCLNQVFSWGASCLAFQCHPEFDSYRVESWLVGHACELQKHNIDIHELRQQSAVFGDQLKRQAVSCIQEWIESIEW